MLFNNINIIQSNIHKAILNSIFNIFSINYYLQVSTFHNNILYSIFNKIFIFNIFTTATCKGDVLSSSKMLMFTPYFK